MILDIIALIYAELFAEPDAGSIEEVEAGRAFELKRQWERREKEVGENI